MSDTVGVMIAKGPEDWQIIQQNARGQASLRLAGRWQTEQKLKAIEIRLVREDRGMPVARHLDWTPVQASPDGTWSGSLARIPAGGLYRLETPLLQEGNAAREWAQRGDLRHFLGVGDVWIIAGQSNSAGLVPVLKVAYTGSAVVRLQLGRELRGLAWVSGAAGTNPPTVPHNMVRFLPMLAFQRFPVD